MKRALLLALILATAAFAQEKGTVVYRTSGSLGGMAWSGGGNPVVGAPYTATITNETVQTLADGNRIVQSSTGTTARDSEGRTRQDTVLPAIGNLSAADAPHIVFIQDPVAKVSYTLNLTDKTAQKIPAPPAMAGDITGAPNTAVAIKVLSAGAAQVQAPDGMPGPMGAPGENVFFRRVITRDDGQVNTEDLGSQTMEGVIVNGTRSTRTIPAGEIGNEKPITVVTEVWTSPDLKTVIYSKRSDPRMGEITFRLTNIVRAEPEPSLFSVPPDFKVVDGPQPILYRAKP